MQLEHSFVVPVSVDEAWGVLLDVERIAPCMPGATVAYVQDDRFAGSVKVKLGPISLTYKGEAAFLERDDTTHRAVIDARGRDARGQSTAKAKITAVLTERGGHTLVDVETDLDVTGKPAQFGRGIMSDVSKNLIDQFAQRLAATLQPESDEKPGDATSTVTDVPTRSGDGSAAGEPTGGAIDMLGTVAWPVAKRALPVAALVVLLIATCRRRR